MKGKPLPDLSRVNGFAYKPHELELSPSSPMISARRLIDDRYSHQGQQLLYRHRGGFYVWQHSHYADISTDYLKADINLFLECAWKWKEAKKKDEDGKLIPFNPNRSQVNEVLGALESVAYVGDVLQPPFWLGDSVPDIDAGELVACANGLLHLPTRELLPHTPLFFTPNSIGYHYSKTPPEPRNWLNFLHQLWPDDPASIQTLQEIFGYCLVADTSQQKAFMLIGPKRSGKGTIARVLQAVIGTHNVVGPTLGSLSGSFGLQPLIGKRLAIISDARLSGRTDVSTIAERLLSITGEDNQSIERKYASTWEGRLDTRFLLLSNELPRLTDVSGALPSRFILLVMLNSFFGHEDHALLSRILPECPGVLNWALDGYDTLNKRGYFLQPESARDALLELEDLASPINAFIRERCELGPSKLVIASELYEAWTSWCGDQGRGLVTNLQTFGRDLRAALPQIKVTQPREFGQRRCYLGIAITRSI